MNFRVKFNIHSEHDCVPRQMSARVSRHYFYDFKNASLSIFIKYTTTSFRNRNSAACSQRDTQYIQTFRLALKPDGEDRTVCFFFRMQKSSQSVKETEKVVSYLKYAKERKVYVK